MGYDPLARRKLGSAPLEVTCLGLGCAPLGGFRRTIPEDEALGIVRSAYDAGARLFDTSPLYGYCRSELRHGQVLRQLPRESFVVSTKVGRWLTPQRPDQSYEGLRAGGSSSSRPTISATAASCARSSSRTAAWAWPALTSF